MVILIDAVVFFEWTAVRLNLNNCTSSTVPIFLVILYFDTTRFILVAS
jgi:hypothetical protein